MEQLEHEAVVQPDKVDLYSFEKKYTSKQIALIDNEIELEDAIVRMKACKAKLKSASKRVDELKKLRHSLMVDPEADSEWGRTNVWSVGSPNLEAQGVGKARENYTIYYLIE